MGWFSRLLGLEMEDVDTRTRRSVEVTARLEMIAERLDATAKELSRSIDNNARKQSHG